MLETNIILKIVSYTYIEPSITVELIIPGRHDALNIADKLNDIAKAKKENTTTGNIVRNLIQPFTTRG